ncbi:hypothetical protein D3C87_1528100 [compost metagenome]
MDAGARIGHQEEQRAAPLGVGLQWHRIAAEADVLVVHRRHGFGRVHHRRQAFTLLHATLFGEGAIGFGGVVVDFRHGLEGLLVRLGHQVEPVGFRQFAGMGKARTQ